MINVFRELISREIYILFLLSILLFVSFDISYNHIVLGEEDSKSNDGDGDTKEKEKEDSDGDGDTKEKEKEDNDGDGDTKEKEKEDNDGDDVPFILPIPFP